MANVVEASQAAAGSAAEGGSALLVYGERLLIVAVVIGLLVAMVIFLRNKFPIVREFMVFLKERKLWWMTPIVVIFIFLAFLIVTATGPLAPFIYALF